MGDLEEARSLFKESLKMDPDNIATQENLRKIESELAQRGHQRK
jgi:methylphosphotriester-DNA--protein-cysteine methyltransferase